MDSRIKICATVKEWIKNCKMFTSVDITNDIKTRGDWISNSEVASILHDNVINISKELNIIYKKTLIRVQGEKGMTNAFVYHASETDPFTYKSRDQKTLGWKDFQKMHGNLKDKAEEDVITIDVNIHKVVACPQIQTAFNFPKS